MITRQSIGILGLLGAVLLIVWAFGFLVLGLHDGLFHVLVPVGAALIIAQGVRRVNTD